MISFASLCGRLSCLLWIAGLIACQSGGSSKPARKKMPEFNSIAEWNNSLCAGHAYQAAYNEGLPFNTGELNILSGGAIDSYVYIPVTDPGSDSLVMNLVNTYKPLAIPMLTAWARQEQKGVLIDFRTKPAQQYQSQAYQVERAGAFRFPVVFIWDGAAAPRAGLFMQTLQQFSAVSCTALTNHNPGLSGCF